MLYAPGLVDAADIRSVVTSVDRPVNVLVLAGVPPVAELAGLGVARVSVGSHFARVATAALVDASTEFLSGTYGWLGPAGAGGAFAKEAFK